MRLASTSSESDQDQRAELPPPQPAAPVVPLQDDAQRALSEGSPKSRGSRGSGRSLAQLTAESLQKACRGDPSALRAHAPTLSLTHAKIHHDAFELLRFSETFPQGATSFSSQGEHGTTMMTLHPASRNALLAMGKSSNGIATELRNMTALAAQADYEQMAQRARDAGDEPQSSHRRHKKHHEQNDDQAGPSQSRRRRVMPPSLRPSRRFFIALTCYNSLPVFPSFYPTAF